MTLSAHGTGTSPVEIGNIDAHGIWVLVGGREYFMPHDGFPWFKKAPLEDVLRVELHHDTHLYWPALDVDLERESLEDPERFPLIAP